MPRIAFTAVGKIMALFFSFGTSFLEHIICPMTNLHLWSMAYPLKTITQKINSKEFCTQSSPKNNTF